MTLTLIHTAEVHRDRFNRLRDRIAPGTRMRHVVRPEWLSRAQSGVDAALTTEISETVAQFGAPVLCTCTTIGAVAEAAGAVRVDWPMMQAAAQAGGAILMVYCLESTFAPSRALLERALAETETQRTVRFLALPQLWPLFEAGEEEAFAGAIADAVRAALAAHGDVAAVILAQASMERAADRLDDLAIPVFASPERALRAVLDMARGSSS